MPSFKVLLLVVSSLLQPSYAVSDYGLTHMRCPVYKLSTCVVSLLIHLPEVMACEWQAFPLSTGSVPAGVERTSTVRQLRRWADEGAPGAAQWGQAHSKLLLIAPLPSPPLPSHPLPSPPLPSSFPFISSHGLECLSCDHVVMRPGESCIYPRQFLLRVCTPMLVHEGDACCCCAALFGCC